MKNQDIAVRGQIQICPHLQQLFTTSPNPVCCLDANGNFLHLSDAFVRLFGSSKDELTGKFYLDLVADNSKAETEAGMKRIRESNSIQFSTTCIKNDRTTFPAAWSCSWNENEDYILCFLKDETDKKLLATLTKQFEVEIEKHSWEISNILDRIGDGFFAVDQNFRITYANPQVEKILNVSRKEYLNRILWDCFPEMNESIFYEKYQRALKEKTPVHFEGFLSSLNSWFEVNAYPSETGLSVVFRDISRRIKAGEDKKRLEEKYREQNRMMVDVLEQMNSGFLTIRLDGKILYWNKEAEKITTILREQVINKMIWEVFPGLETSPFFKLYEYLLEHKGPIFKEVFSPFRNRWVEVNAYTTPNGISVFFRDIHEKKKTEEEVHKLSLIVKGTANGVCIVDMDGKVSWVNDAYTHITGYEFDEVKGKNPHELLVCDGNSKQMHDRIRECFMAGSAWKEEIVCFNKNRDTIWLECNGKPLYDLEGKFNQYFLIFTEITERKNAEKELHKLSLIAEQTVNSVAISDGDQKIIWVNKACLDLSGYTLEEAIGKSTHELFDGPQTDETLINYSRECVQKRIPFRIEVLNYKKNGETYWADVSCQPLFDKAGELQCFFSIATDITERKLLEQQLEAQRNNTTAAVIAAQERERALVGQELHDNVNQVLTTVKLYTELCRDGIGNAEDLYEKSLSLLQNSINEIRNLSKRLSAPTLGNIRLSDSVKELVDAISGTNKVVIDLDVCGLEHLEVSQELHLALYRILQEHFTNILKHADAVKVDVLLEQANDKLVLRVIDDGKGFDLNEKRYGIGITNMITRTDSLNGSISFNTSPGQGCELLVQLPLR